MKNLEHATTIISAYSEAYRVGEAAIKRYLDNCARGYVDLAKLFSFCTIQKPAGGTSMIMAR